MSVNVCVSVQLRVYQVWEWVIVLDYKIPIFPLLSLKILKTPTLDYKIPIFPLLSLNNFDSNLNINLIISLINIKKKLIIKIQKSELVDVKNFFCKLFIYHLSHSKI